MSLLMDALRKAEEAKRAATQTDNAPSEVALPLDDGSGSELDSIESTMSELGLEPLPTADTATTKSTPASAQAAHAASPAELTAQRQAAQNAFAAKAATKTPEDKVFILALACVAGIAALGIGVYVWWQMQPHSSLGPRANMPITAARPAVPPTAPPVQTVSPIDIASLPATEEIERSTPRSAPPPPAPDPIRITHSQARVNPLLDQGYAALQQGNLPQAQQAYERMLAADPKSTDAMYGLAAIAVQRDQPAQAENYYLRILESDPRDPYAHAGLTGLRGHAGGSNVESRLKTLIADQPGVAPLHFALGNLYAQDQRWRDAQQSYFLAYKNDSSNPDIAFNLAVSLDQLHQGNLAAQYYSEALRLSASQRAAFNREQVQLRLRELQATTAP